MCFIPLEWLGFPIEHTLHGKLGFVDMECAKKSFVTHFPIPSYNKGLSQLQSMIPAATYVSSPKRADVKSLIFISNIEFCFRIDQSITGSLRHLCLNFRKCSCQHMGKSFAFFKKGLLNTTEFHLRN